jgi:hypothetical protein
LRAGPSMFVSAIVSGHRRHRRKRADHGALGQFNLKAVVFVSLGRGQFGLSCGPERLLVR